LQGRSTADGWQVALPKRSLKSRGVKGTAADFRVKNMRGAEAPVR